MLAVLLDFLDSSSSDDDETEALTSVMLEILDRRRNRFSRQVENFIRRYNDEEFKRHFKLRKDTAHYLIRSYENDAHYVQTSKGGGKRVVTAETQVLSFLWYAANRAVLRDVASMFNVGESTMFSILTRVMKFLFDISSEIIKMPTTAEEKAAAAEDFAEISGFPGAIGVVDAWYIKMKMSVNKIAYITLQGICNAKNQFIDAFTGVSSSFHDGRVYELSFISKTIQNICGEGYHIIGDTAYPTREWLMTPYCDYGDLTLPQQNFNEKLYATLVTAGNTFSLLKNRFKQLESLEFMRVERACTFVLACCVLHNICQARNDFVDLEDPLALEQQGDIEPPEETEEGGAILKQLGEAKRHGMTFIKV